jgi:hypothetical protein
MSNEYSEYELGEEVTQLAKGKGAKNTTVVSVRLSVEEVARLEGWSQQTGKSISDIVRDAISNYTPSNESDSPVVLFGIAGGSAFSFGSSQGTGGTVATTQEIPDLIEVNGQ